MQVFGPTPHSWDHLWELDLQVCIWKKKIYSLGDADTHTLGEIVSYGIKFIFLNMLCKERDSKKNIQFWRSLQPYLLGGPTYKNDSL